MSAPILRRSSSVYPRWKKLSYLEKKLPLGYKKKFYTSCQFGNYFQVSEWVLYTRNLMSSCELFIVLLYPNTEGN